MNIRDTFAKLSCYLFHPSCFLRSSVSPAEDSYCCYCLAFLFSVPLSYHFSPYLSISESSRRTSERPSSFRMTSLRVLKVPGFYFLCCPSPTLPFLLILWLKQRFLETEQRALQKPQEEMFTLTWNVVKLSQDSSGEVKLLLNGGCGGWG